MPSAARRSTRTCARCAATRSSGWRRCRACRCCRPAASAPRSCPSSPKARIRTTWARCSTTTASQCAPATTARSRCSTSWASGRPRARRSRSTTRPTKSSAWPTASPRRWRSCGERTDRRPLPGSRARTQACAAPLRADAGADARGARAQPELRRRHPGAAADGRRHAARHPLHRPGLRDLHRVDVDDGRGAARPRPAGRRRPAAALSRGAHRRGRRRRRRARQTGQPRRREPLPEPDQVRAARLACPDARAAAAGRHRHRRHAGGAGVMRPHREPVIFRRPVTVELVPYGTPFELDAGMTGQITQALGGNFTLVVDGVMVRLKGSDADAIGKELPTAQPPAEEDDGADLQTRIWRTLATCYDPEIPVDIVELGLIYACDLKPMDDGRTQVDIEMTLTAPGCGMGEALANEVADKVLALEGVGTVNVNLVFEPPWDRSRMSEAAQLALGL